MFNHKIIPTNQILGCLCTVAVCATMTALSARAGVVLDLLYQDSNYPGGNAVTNLTVGDLSYPSAPNGAQGQITGLQDFTGIGTAFGTWLRGWIEAPQTGTNYIFWIASDADSQLWLSTDATTNNRVLICQNVGAVGVEQYTATAAQKSAPISLVAGQKYYYEVFHTEGTSTAEHCEVAWQLPDGTYEPIVLPQHLWAFTEASLTGPPQPTMPQILTSYQGATVTNLQSTTTVGQALPLDLIVTIEASQPAGVQWYSNNIGIPGAILATYHIPSASLAANGAVYSVIVTNDQGSANTSTTLSVTPDTTPPTLVDALNLGNPGHDIAVVFSESVDPTTAANPANYSINNGASITGLRMGATPDTVLLQVSNLVIGTAYTITVNNVNDLAGNTITTSSTVALEANLDTWYQLDESGGTVAADSSGNGRNGALLNDVIPGYTGKVLKGYKYAGLTGGVVKFPSGFADFTTNGLTIALWAYPTIEGAQANWDRFTDFGITNNADNILFSRSGTAQTIHFEVYKGAASGGAVDGPSGSLMINQWQHFVATMDTAGNVVLYRNGVAVATGTVAVPNIINRTSNLLGHSNWSGDDFYTGKMDDVRIYDRVLSPGAVAALANGGGADDLNSNVPSVSVTATVASTALKNTPPGVFTVTRSFGYTNVALTVRYALGGTATNGVTYTNLSGSVVIPAGTNSATISIQPIDFSFIGLQQTAVLTLIDTTNYSIANSDSGTVTIANNDVTPAAIEATTANAIGSLPVTADVWFSAAVANPSATNLANYTLVGAPGVTITNAVLSNRNLRVVLSLSGVVPAGAQLAVSGVQDPGGNSTPVQIPIRLGLTNPANVVANVYHGGTATRATAFTWMTDGVVNNVNNGGTGFDTYDGAGSHAPFAGLLYLTAEDIQVIKVDLGQQFSDGGDWLSQPSVYLLTNALDTGSIAPNTNAANWVQVNAKLISGGVFQSAADGASVPSPNTPIVFDLTALPVSQRMAYGWAVGGTNGNGAQHFLSFTELRAFGASFTNPATVFVTQPTNITVQAGQRAKFSAVVDSVLPITPQWNDNSSAAAGFSSLSVVFPWPSLANESSWATPPLTMADNGSQINLVANNAVGAIPSQTVTLTVLPRTTPPAVVDATYDPSNIVVELWFDESTDPGSSQNPANYALSDSSVSINSAVQDAQGFHVTLSLSAAPNITNLTVTAAGVLDTSGNTLTSQTASVLPLVTAPVNLVADAYQQGYYNSHARSTDGVVIHDSNVTTWTTFGGFPSGLNPNSNFVGLQYNQPSVFNLLKVDLGYQFGDGGDWAAQPRVFILKNPVYTAQTAPETDPADWLPVPARQTSGSIFDIMPDAPANTVPPPNTPIAFDLSQLPLNQRTGYGWAVGGVPGNGPNSHFVSIAELRGFGLPVSAPIPGSGAPQIVFDLPSSVTQPIGSTFNSFIGATGSQPLSYQWRHNGVPSADNGRVTGSHTSALTVATAGGADGGTYQVIVTNSFGSATSAVETVTFATTALNNGAGWVLNSATTNVPIAGNALTLTDGGGGEARSSFLNPPQYIRAFRAAWTYQDIGGGGADGACFVLQNDPRGVTALGGGGGSLGYSGITPSVALEFNIYSGNAPSASSSGFNFQVNGATGKPYTDATPVNPASGIPVNVQMTYDGTTVSVGMSTNTTPGSQFTTSYTADLPTMLGTNTAYVGFTGASGGVASKQIISNFSFTSLFPTLSIQTTGANTVALSWPASGGMLTVQQSSSLIAPNWADVTNAVVLVGSQNQVAVPIQGQTEFYRVVLQ